MSLTKGLQMSTYYMFLLHRGASNCFNGELEKIILYLHIYVVCKTFTQSAKGLFDKYYANSRHKWVLSLWNRIVFMLWTNSPKPFNVSVLKEMSCLYTSVQLMACVSFADWFQTTKLSN